jgi:cytoskeleton protein RodZ
MIPQPHLVHPETEPPVVAMSPGKRLQRAREMQGLSQADVANSLRLPLNVVKALEEDQHDGIHATYLKGYLRSYARLVGVSTDLVVADIRQTLADRQAEVLKAQAAQPQMNSSHNVMKLTTLAVCTVLLGLGVTWWRGQNDADETPVTDVVDAAPIEQSVPLIPTLAESVAVAETPVAQTDTAVQALRPEGSSDKPQQVAVSEPQVSEAQATTTSDQQALAAPAPETAETSAAAVATDRSAPADSGIVLRLSDDSWTEIADAGGKRLYKKLGKRGETIKIADGKAPFRVLVGNAHGIAMYYDGKLVDLGTIAHNGVARFRIEADGTAHK